MEMVVGRIAYGKNVYRLNDLVSSLSSGASRLLIAMFFDSFIERIYLNIWNRHAIYRMEYDSWPTFIGLFLLTDLCYYWVHRFAHTYHLSWTGHAPHHTGEDYNLSTGLRQGGLQGALTFFFYLPLALFFPPSAYKVHAFVNTLSQFWFHTNLLGKLGPLEYVLNTPSHHRMHHRPPGNCNYGGFLIIFDRMFGTFVPEDRKEDYYGLAESYDTFDTVWANFFHLKRIAQKVPPRADKWAITPSFISAGLRRRANHPMRVSVGALVEPIPELKDGQSSWAAPMPSLRRPQSQKWDGQTELSTASKAWMFVTFLLVNFVLFYAVASSTVTVYGPRGVYILVVLALFSLQGRVFDAKRSLWTPLFDIARTLLIVGCALKWTPVFQAMQTLHGSAAAYQVSLLASTRPLWHMHKVPMALRSLEAREIFALVYLPLGLIFAGLIYRDVMTGPVKEYKALPNVAREKKADNKSTEAPVSTARRASTSKPTPPPAKGSAAALAAAANGSPIPPPPSSARKSPTEASSGQDSSPKAAVKKTEAVKAAAEETDSEDESGRREAEAPVSVARRKNAGKAVKA